jgi:hypothetical protein
MPAEGGYEPTTDPGYGDVASEAPEQSSIDEAPARQYVEVDDPDNRYVRTRVNGEDIEVPYSEFQRGYSREADYTRKSQDVAQLRQEAELGLRLQAALQADPQATIRLLQDRYGRSEQQPTQAEPEFDDPLERQLHQERVAREALEQRLNAREADETLQRAVGDLRTQFGANDEDIRNAVTFAYQNQWPVEALPMIYKTMAFDRIQATVQAHRDAQAAQAAEATRRQEAALRANGMVAQGTGAPTNGLGERQLGDQPITIRQAIEAAFEQAGM